jgi:hypothetical protein
MIKSSLIPGSDYASAMQTGKYGVRMQYNLVAERLFFLTICYKRTLIVPRLIER